jgi:hypothetical protein
MCLLAEVEAVHGGDLPRLELGRLEELGEREVWEAGAGLCGGYVRWVEPLGDMSVESGTGWSGVGWANGRRGRAGWAGRGEWRGSGMGGEGFRAKRDGHRAVESKKIFAPNTPRCRGVVL